MDDRLVREALLTQEEERRVGFTGPNHALQRLREELSPPEVLALAAELRNGDTPERELAARVVSQSTVTGGEVLDFVRRALREEREPQVIRWLVAALEHARRPEALPDLQRLAHHPDPRVRVGVPDALSSSFDRFAEVADMLYSRAQDADDGVRWSAVFELGAWLGDEGATAAERAELASRLRRAAELDEDAEIRRVAREALEEHGQPSA